jgi:biotin-dependent carboxylase-like uncharacterized protein
MPLELFEVCHPGLAATLQDHGRPGWRKWGVPAGGPMDDHAAGWANRLLDNPSGVPVLELLLQGAQLRALCDSWIAITGAEAKVNLPVWAAVQIRRGDILEFPRNQVGVWTYIAVESGFQADCWLGSVSAYPRAALGAICRAGDVLRRAQTNSFALPRGVAGRWLEASQRRDYNHPAPLRVWPGPQWEAFSGKDRQMFFNLEWTVSSQSDRVGYRLTGVPMQPAVGEIISEPVRVGSIQIPDNGQPVVTMRDGPTVGGYPKLGLVHSSDLSRLAQCRPGQKVRFMLVDETGPEL